MMAVEPESGFILGVELLSVEETMEDMRAQIPGKFLEMARRNRVRPASLALRTLWVATVLDPVCRELGIEIVHDPELPALRQARRNLERFNRR